MEKIAYPGITERVKAIMADTTIIIFIAIILSNFFEIGEGANDQTRLIALILLFGLYDPVLTSIFGGTLGHMAMGIRVKRIKNEQKNILFPLAIIRYLIKLSFGWLSLLSVSKSKKGRAIHDSIVGSVVIYK